MNTVISNIVWDIQESDIVFVEQELLPKTIRLINIQPVQFRRNSTDFINWPVKDFKVIVDATDEFEVDLELES